MAAIAFPTAGVTRRLSLCRASSSLQQQRGLAPLLKHRGLQLKAPRAAVGPGYVAFHASSPGASFHTASAAAAAGDTAPLPAAATPVSPAAAPAKPAKASKVRLPALDSLRFFLISYIAVGHFVGFATKSPFLLRLLTQVNVWVGAFFVLSGYVAGYTGTEVGKFEASARVQPAGAYTVARVAGFYPLFAFVQVLFGVMFAFADNFYNGPITTFVHFLMTATLTQAWFPGHAEIWNAPTWFLSALAFAMLILPHVLPKIASLRKSGLKKLLFALTAFSLLGKLAYSYDLGVWTILEGLATPRNHPNILYWNITRFHPFYALLEILTGVAACRLVMIDNIDDEGNPLDTPPKPAGSVLLPVLGMLAITFLRAGGWLPLNDPLTRTLLFLPLFVVTIMRLHRTTLAGAKGLTAILGHPLLVYLGNISFPMFVLHGALGQLFYKKLIATRVWGGVMPLSFFPAYCAIVLLASAAVQKFFVENKKVQEVTGKISKAIATTL